MMELVVTSGAIRRAKVQSNHHSSFYRLDALPVTQTTVSKYWREKYHIPRTCSSQIHMQLPLQEGCQASCQPSDAKTTVYYCKNTTTCYYFQLLTNLPVLLQTLYCRIITMKNCNTVKNLSVGVYIAFSHNASLSLFVFFLSLRFNGHFPGEPGLAGVYWSKGWWKWWWQLEL